MSTETPAAVRTHHFDLWQGSVFITLLTADHAVLDAHSRDLIFSLCLDGDGRHFKLYAAVVMPDHVHLVLSPLDGNEFSAPLPYILGALKVASENAINIYRFRRDTIWHEESFCHYVRSTGEFDDSLQYVSTNPVRKNLVDDSRQYRWTWVRDGLM